MEPSRGRSGGRRGADRSPDKLPARQPSILEFPELREQGHLAHGVLRKRSNDIPERHLAMLNMVFREELEPAVVLFFRIITSAARRNSDSFVFRRSKHKCRTNNIDRRMRQFGAADRKAIPILALVASRAGLRPPLIAKGNFQGHLPGNFRATLLSLP